MTIAAPREPAVPEGPGPQGFAARTIEARPIPLQRSAATTPPELRSEGRSDVAAAAAARTAGARAETGRYARRVLVADVVAAAAVATGAYVSTDPHALAVTVSAWVFPLVWVGCLAAARAFEPRFMFSASAELARVLRAGAILAVVAALSGVAVGTIVPRDYLALLVAGAVGGTLLERHALRHSLRRGRRAGTAWMRRVLVVGHHGEVDVVLRELHRDPSQGFRVVGVCLGDDDVSHDFAVPVRHGIPQAASYAEELGVDAVVAVPCRHLSNGSLRRLGWELESSGTELFVAPGLIDVAHSRATLAPIGHLPLLHVNHAELRGGRRVLKGMIDRAGAALLLLVAAPVLGLLMLAVRLDSPGPALFRQERVGRDDHRFTLFKLRTMTADAESLRGELAGANEVDGLLFKMRQDPRVTRLGRLLRKYSLDELPQLLNVVRGDMSLVGPRPPLPSEVEGYDHHVRRRLAVKPGITGLWQVSGRSNLSWDEAVRLDIRYVDNWSLALDLKILWRTGRAVLCHDGAY